MCRTLRESTICMAWCAGRHCSLLSLCPWTVQDTAGIHNLHGMPGVLGGIASTICMAWCPHMSSSSSDSGSDIASSSACKPGSVSVSEPADFFFPSAGRHCSLLSLCPWHVQDTAGIHNLHGMPGVLGGIAAGVGSYFIQPTKLGAYPHGSSQWAWQFVAVGCMLLVAIGTGALAGFLVKSLNPMGQSLNEHGFFEDALFWEEVEEEDEADSTRGFCAPARDCCPGSVEVWAAMAQPTLLTASSVENQLCCSSSFGSGRFLYSERSSVL